ncbi:hypothetical protein RhiirB3_520262 [Rhizophagus irregularis]|nr:hypothetical protein RhiirB3_520262 [Rhizophagus irregularis]
MRGLEHSRLLFALGILLEQHDVMRGWEHSVLTFTMRGLEHSRLLFGKLVGTSFCCSPAIGPPKLWVFLLEQHDVMHGREHSVLTFGNSELDEFIKETQNDSKYCDFIEWIPNNYLENPSRNEIFLVNEDRRILISDFGFCKPIDSTIGDSHDKDLALQIIGGRRPDIIKGTPIKRKTPIDFSKNDEERTSVTNDDFVDVKPLPQYDSPTDSKEKSTEPEYEYETKTFEYTTSIDPIDFSKNDEEGASVTVGLMSHVYVLGVKRISTFFRFSNTILKTIVTSQKSESDNDVPYQLWRHENGYLINKQTNLYLDVDSDVRVFEFSIIRKLGKHIVLCHQKPDTNGANQQWTLTKEGYIVLKSHPKYVINVKGTKMVRLEIIEAKDLKKVDSFFTGGNESLILMFKFHYDSQDIMTQTKFIENTLDPIWSEVHYLPVKNIGDKFILDIIDFNSFTKDKPLGYVIFEVTKELVKEVSPNVWANLSGQGKLHYKAKFYPLTLDALPKPTENFLVNLKEKPFDKSTLYILITLQTPNSSFPPSNTLANLQSGPLVLWFLRFLLKEQSEWAGIYERSEQYITKELGGDLEVEEIAIAGGRKAVRERFEIKDDLIVYSKTIVIARRTVSVRLFGSAEEAKKSLETHFSSYSKISKLDVNLHSSAIMIWFVRYVLADFRIDKYQITSKWITEQRFDVDDEVLKVDETFKSTLALNIPLNIKKEIEDEIKSENGAIVTQVIIGLLKIKIKNARNLPKSSLLFTYSKPDPYVRILDASGQEIVRTRTISETTEPKWEEVHYVSIHGTGENITFEIMDKNLSVADKPSCEPIRELFSLVIGRKPSGGELDLEVQFVSTQYNWKESFVFKKKTLTIEHIYIILSWRNTRSYFEFSDDIAHFFNYKSQEELKIIIYLKILCWKFCKAWKNISADSDNIDKLYEICENFIIKRFNIKDLDEEQKNILISVKKRVIITRKLVTIRVIRRIHVYQTQDGAIPLDKTAELLGFENTEDLKKELQTYFKNYRIEWIDIFNKASEYLSIQFNDLGLESDVLECAKIYN